MRCLVFAYSQLGYDCLQYIIEETPHTVVAVVTHEHNPNEYIWFDSVKDLAADHGIDVLTPETLKDESVQHQISAYQPDAIFSFYYRNMIPDVILKHPRLGAYNIHGSLLPKYRGRCPVNWAMIHGESETGVTLHHMVKAADAGDIVDQESTPISTDDTAGSVMNRMNALAVTVLKRSLPLIATQTAPRIVQEVSQASYFGGRSAKDGEINWVQSAIFIHNLVRALQPSPQYPPAFGIINGEVRNIMQSRVVENLTGQTRQPGTIIDVIDCHTFHIACGENGQDALWVRTIS
ncbi:MAG: formyltransferase [Alphaproteobacteria bacterium]|nr:formyltransferase [Alphaproteobacteria bacterium]